MSHHRTSITIPKRLFDDAQPLIAHHYCTNFSEYVTALIKQDVLEAEKRKQLLAASAAALAEQGADYAKRKRH